MSERWFFGEGGRGYGPFSADQLQQLQNLGLLTPADVVWRDRASQDITVADLGATEGSQPPSRPRNLTGMIAAAAGVVVLAVAGFLGSGRFWPTSETASTPPVIASVASGEPATEATPAASQPVAAQPVVAVAEPMAAASEPVVDADAALPQPVDAAPKPAIPVTKAVKFEGWIAYDVFDKGVSLDQAIAASTDGTLIVPGGVEGICLATRQEFSTYTLRFEYLLSKESPGVPFVSVAARSPNPSGQGFLQQFPFGIELKLWPNEAGMVVLPHPDFSVTLAAGQSRHDQDRREVLPLQQPAVTLGDWNTVEIVSDEARNVTFKINGVTVNGLAGVQKTTGHFVVWPGKAGMRMRNAVVVRNGVGTKLSFQTISEHQD